jgi:hypothetical protein
MSYLAEHAWTRRPSAQPARSGARVDERTRLNRPEFDGGAHVRAFVEDTSQRRTRRRRPPSPRLKLRITDCTNEIHLEFSVDSAAARENSLYKIETLIAALDRFRHAFAAEAELWTRREQRSTTKGGAKCRT